MLRGLSKFILGHPTLFSSERLPQRFHRMRSVSVDLHLNALLDSERFDKEYLEALQKQRLCHLLNYSRKHIRFWKEQLASFPAQITISEVTEQFRRLPIIVKSFLQTYPRNELIAEHCPPSRVKTSYTSGSTGIPLNFLLDKQSVDRSTAQYLRPTRWFGLPSASVVRMGPRDFLYTSGIG